GRSGRSGGSGGSGGGAAQPPISFEQIAQQLAATGPADAGTMRQMIDTATIQEGAALQNMPPVLAATNLAPKQQMVQQPLPPHPPTPSPTRGEGEPIGKHPATPSPQRPQQPAAQQQQQRLSPHPPTPSPTRGEGAKGADSSKTPRFKKAGAETVSVATLAQYEQQQPPLMTIAEYRQQYRHIYDDITDSDLVDQLHQQFYRHFSRTDYEQKIGWETAAAASLQTEELETVYQALDRGEKRVAFRLLLRLAQRGVVEGQFHLGYWLASGIGTERDLDRASIWFQRAADTGHELAYSNLLLLKSMQLANRFRTREKDKCSCN
ncbi:MAG: sel1 repeat family protein, partial [Magnetococcales bacterium]|nr:sel1 repeat family protein [Magnetococcales bacterium]